MLKLKVKDRVRSKVSGEIGVVAYVNPCGMRDCVVVRFRPTDDGLTLLKSSLELVKPEGQNR